MAMVKYKGLLGEFEYDDTEFAISNPWLYLADEDENDLQLLYIGEETDGSKIKIPDGIKDCSYMFGHIDCPEIESAPVIPDGVINCNEMFTHCTSLKETPVIPDSVKSCVRMFEGCSSLEKVHNIPKSALHCGHMFYNCTILKQAPDIPDSVLDAPSMFSECSSMEEPPALGSNLRDTAYMFKNCESLKYAPYVPHSVKNCKSMFMGCKSLDVSHMPKELEQDLPKPETREALTDDTQSTDDNEKVRCFIMSKKSIIYSNDGNDIIKEGYQGKNYRDKPDFTDDNGWFIDKGDNSVHIDKDKSDLIVSGSDHGDNSDPYMPYGGEEGGRAVAMQGVDPPSSGNKYFADTDPNDNTSYDIDKKYATAAYNESQDDEENSFDNEDDKSVAKSNKSSDNTVTKEERGAYADFVYDNDNSNDGDEMDIN